ncbi:uncharacterized protein AC631_03523 [Debaryomyces fabryi]|uniref:Uncharacterized protein n=1 Tax=Debaryomyces fabryi TaxID=58627 RepID=A0A0V1PWY9_9ASCO|nr:uncharacterized protein AC631_03523 [Debaryomyces fabryi]KSA00704.1 hypothetical protein AC631_03523 [Debaryomyces fabryi]CUM52119.1 unnamed protein product [Debaryomyces fabryi]
MKLCIWHVIVVSYAIVYVTSIPWYLFLHQFKDKVSDNSFIAFINQNLIVRCGYLLFTVAYFSEALTYSDCELMISRSRALKILRSYSLYTSCTVILLGWFFGPLIYERVNTLTGGYCNTKSQDSGVAGQFQCTRIPGAKWIDGFDVSGHIYILLTMSLLLWERFLENLNVRHFSQLYEGYAALRTYFSKFDWEDDPSITPEEPEYSIQTEYSHLIRLLFFALTVSLLSIWSMMYIVTCVFFHTLSEKLVLLIVGIAISLAITSLN